MLKIPGENESSDFPNNHLESEYSESRWYETIHYIFIDLTSSYDFRNLLDLSASTQQTSQAVLSLAPNNLPPHTVALLHNLIPKVFSMEDLQLPLISDERKSAYPPLQNMKSTVASDKLCPGNLSSGINTGWCQ